MDDPLIFKYLATATFIVTTLFIALFVSKPWWRHPYGVSVIMLAVGVWLFVLATVLRQWLGLHYPGRNAVRITAQLAVFIAMAERTVELIVVDWRNWRARRKTRSQS